MPCNSLGSFGGFAQEETLFDRYIQFLHDFLDFLSKKKYYPKIKYMNKRNPDIKLQFGGAGNNFGAQNPYVYQIMGLCLSRISQNYMQKSFSFPTKGLSHRSVSERFYDDRDSSETWSE